MPQEQRRGYLLAITAYSIWGLFPLYWKLLAHVDSLEVLAHRTGWSVVFVGLLLAFRGGWGPVRETLRRPREVLLLACSALGIALNWGIYIWAVANAKVVEASMGYYLAPLLSVLVGALVFGERLRRWQLLAVTLAAAGVVNQLLSLGVVPWIGLSVGISFALYGAIRKGCRCDSITGLFVETLLLAPAAFAWMAWLEAQGVAHFLHAGWGDDLLLLACGAVTATPLLLYVGGARRLPLASMGLLFYVTPTLQFLIGTLLYAESVSPVLLITFASIWAALALYTLEGRWHARRVGIGAT